MRSHRADYFFVFIIDLLTPHRITLSLDIYGVALVYTSATLAAATTNCLPAITFFLALLFGYVLCIVIYDWGKIFVQRWRSNGGPWNQGEQIHLVSDPGRCFRTKILFLRGKWTVTARIFMWESQLYGADKLEYQ